MMRRPALIAAAMAAILCASAWPSSSAGAMSVGSAAGIRLASEGIDPIGTVRCCRWGPHGWYDTWRSCRYCGWRRRPCDWPYRGYW